MKNLILTLVLMCTWMVSTVDAQELSLKDIQRAACRVRVSGGMGSGTVFAKDAGKYYIISNDHVTGRAKNCNVDFYYDGYRSKGVPGQVIWQRRSGGSIQYDMSIITIDENAFGSDPNDHPVVIPIAPRNTPINRDDYIFGCGNPQGKWLYSWQSRVLSVTDRINFNRPPIGGESGSSILTNVNGKTMIIGLVTWSISPPGQDEYGGGVHLEALHKAFIGEANVEGKFPENVLDQYTIPVTTQSEEQYRHIHVKGSDGKTYHGRAYETGRRVGLNMPTGVTPIEFVQCPDGNCPGNGGGGGGLIPFLNGGRDGSEVPPQQGGGRGGSGVWPNKPPIGIGGSGDSDKPTTPIQSLPKPDDKKIKELEEKIAALQAELEALKPANKKLEDEIAAALSDLVKLKNEKESLSEEKTKLEDKLTELDNVVVVNKTLIEEKKSLLDKIEGLIGKIADKDVLLKKLEEKLGITEKDLDAAKQSPVSNIYNYGVKIYNGDIKLGEGLLLIGGCLAAYFLGKRYGTNSTVNTAIYLLRLAGRRVLLHDKTTIGVVEEEDKKKSELVAPKLPEMVYNKEEEKVSVKTAPVEVIVNNTNNVSSNAEPCKENKASGVLPESFTSDYIIGWVQNKEKDGECVEKSALFAILYREAVQKLRKGEFVKDGYALNFQKLAADKIDEYVKTKFHLGMTCEKLSRDQRYNEAMIAFLYKEAIELLRQGKFEVLGNEQIADQIDLYVKTEFYKRLGIKF